MISIAFRVSFLIGAPPAVMHSIRILQSRPIVVMAGKAVSSLELVLLVASVNSIASALTKTLPTTSACPNAAEIVIATRKGLAGPARSVRLAAGRYKESSCQAPPSRHC